VSWTNAEWALKAANVDILGLFDCCHAGELNRTRGSHVFEYLGANSAGLQITMEPGQTSFTSALIWALEELWTSDGQPFTTSRLQQKIKDFPHFPKDQIPCLVPRGGGHEHISLRPQQHDESSVSCVEAKLSKLSRMSTNVVDIRLHFRENLDDDGFVELAKALRHALHTSEIKILASRAQFLGMLFPMEWGDIAMKMTQRIKLIHFCYHWLRRCNIPIKSTAKSLNEWKSFYKKQAETLVAPGDGVLVDTIVPNYPHPPLVHTSEAGSQSNEISADDRLHTASYADRSSVTSITMHDNRPAGPTVQVLGGPQKEIDHEKAHTTLGKTTGSRSGKRFFLLQWARNIRRRRRVTLTES
jgi:hypothetical protein